MKRLRVKLNTAIASLIVASLCMGGCNRDKKPATQVVVSVDGVDISVYQLNDAVTNLPGINADNAEKARREILRRLIDQQLAVARAQESGLDKSLQVVQAIESAKREILSRAYLEKVTSTVPKSTDDEAKAYYKANLQLFAERRIFSLEEIGVPVEAITLEALAALSANKSMEDIAKALTDQKMKFSANTSAKAAEQLPLVLLPKIQAMKDGETQFFQGKGTTSIMHMVASKPAPVGEAAALPKIRQFLDNQKSGAVIETEIKNMRAKAKIVFTAGRENLGDAKPLANVPAALPGKVPAVNVEKGVAGLK